MKKYEIKKLEVIVVKNSEGDFDPILVGTDEEGKSWNFAVYLEGEYHDVNGIRAENPND